MSVVDKRGYLLACRGTSKESGSLTCRGELSTSSAYYNSVCARLLDAIVIPSDAEVEQLEHVEHNGNRLQESDAHDLIRAAHEDEYTDKCPLNGEVCMVMSSWIQNPNPTTHQEAKDLPKIKRK